MKYINFFSRNRTQFSERTNPGIILDATIIHNFFWGLLLLACSCFAGATLASAEEARSDAWGEAFTLIDKGERRRAVSKLESLLQSDLPESDKLRIHHALGYNYEKLRNRPKAVGHYARVASLSYPLADCAVYRLAQLYESMNNGERAIKWYTQLVKNYPTSFYGAAAKWTLGQLHLERKEYETAKSYLVDLVKHPQYAREATFAFARCDEGLGNVSDAFNTYRELIKEKQSYSVAEESLGRLKLLARSHKSLKLTPTDRLNCGMVFFSNRQWRSAVSELALIPKTAGLEMRAHALYLTGRSNRGRKWPNTAIKNFNAVIALGGKNSYIPRAAYQIAQCYRQKGHLKTAVSRLETFVKTYPENELVDDALYDIAQIREKRDQSELALDAYSRLIKVAPNSPYADVAAWRTGWQRFDERRYEESYNAFKGLKEHFPGNRYAMGAHFWMAKIRERQNKPEFARKLYKEVAEARYWYYSARAKAILGVGGSELEPKAVQDADIPERQACPSQVQMLMELRLYEDAIPQLDHHINTTSFPEQRCFHDLIACYEGLAMYDKARKVTEKSLESSAFANATRADLEKLQHKLYPRYYADAVDKYAKMYNVDTFLIAAMILEESRYNAEAVSWAGAIGLMQIMPATGRELAQKLKIRRFRTSMLKQPDINIRMGTKYIGELNSWFDGNSLLVIGAYNGGPGRMERWVSTKNIKDIDLFVEKITIRETRLHIKKVIDSYDNYVEIYRKTDEPPAVNSATEIGQKRLEGF
ncbi:MAG: transglycosylase SLT domain-containing protein [Candidatus Poribacteria bacterium]|nr:transglycosylase SLT domain-containing protein [Candidatus Poribacteria bacterium]